MNNVDLNNYQLILVRDEDDYPIMYPILINKKHSLEDFQEAIYYAKNVHSHDIEFYGEPWYYIRQELKNDYDFIELPYDDMKNNLNF